MSILSWNCQGAGGTETVQRLRKMRKEHFPDFLFLMETKQRDDYVFGLKGGFGYDEVVTVEPIGLSGGLAVFWKSCYEVEVISKDNRIIDLRVKMGSLTFFITCVYGDPVRARRQEVWTRLSNIGASRDDAWVLVGDFNELLEASEKVGGAVRDDSTYWDFRTMVDDCRIKEIRSSGNQLSWCGWRDQVWVQCRLDRSFGNNEWFTLFPRAHMEYFDILGSDHRPILIRFAYEPDSHSRGRFFFDQRCMTMEGVEEIVKRGWLCDAGTDTPLMDRITSCRVALSRWKRSSDHNSKDRITRLHQQFEQVIASPYPDKQRMQQLRSELVKAYRDEEVFWRQKNRTEWLKVGDSNTRFFHNSVKGRKTKNRVLMLKDSNGIEHFNEGSKGAIAVEFYKDLFTSSNPSNFDDALNSVPPKVSEEFNTMLTAPITDEEIRLAAFAIKSGSTPGEDGFSGAFYKRFWHIVGPCITSEIHKFFATAVLPKEWNHTQICLIPKITKPTSMTDMRPISLCTVQYKIVSKILCSRLKRIRPEVVSETQGAFVAGRQITDNILIAHELVHALQTDPKISTEYMALKIDMSKAYDRVEWNFVELLLERLGFDHIWVRWVMACITSVSYTVLLNGRTHGFIKPERGIRQGDPLSPFIFILAAEALVHSLNQAENRGDISGIRLKTGCPSVHHLLFADDSLLLCKATKEESSHLASCLAAYGAVSGQCINKTKSSIIFGKKVELATRDEVIEVLGITKLGGEGHYLGLPEAFSGSKRKLLSFIHENLKGRLQSWNSKNLSYGGKETLVKSVCLALPTYAMQCFKLSKDLCGKLKSAMTQYWWSNGDGKRKIPWVAWDKMCKKKSEGGLGFTDLANFNQALLCKQAWRLLTNENSLIARIYKGRYYPRKSLVECGVGPQPSYAWRSILHGRELLKLGLISTIGDGKGTNVWLDNWLLDGSPRPPVPRDSHDVSLFTVNDLMYPGTNIWNRELIRDVFSARDVELILRIRPNLQLSDSYAWSETATGVYTVQSGRKLLEKSPLSNIPAVPPLPPIERSVWSQVWKIKTLPKIRHFVWRAMSGALAVAQTLIRRNIQTDRVCKLCGGLVENICHVLFLCPAAEQVWNAAGVQPPPRGFSRSSVLLNVHFLLSCAKKQCWPEEIRAAWPWILWHIWKARNNVIYERWSSTSDTTLRLAVEEYKDWTVANRIEEEETLVLTNTTRASVVRWFPPAENYTKCNFDASWNRSSRISGAAWITRNNLGRVSHHGRRTFAFVTSTLEAHLLSFSCAVESMTSLRYDKVIFECSNPLLREALDHPRRFPLFRTLIASIHRDLQGFEYVGVSIVPEGANSIASRIANSVYERRRHQSYVAANGPQWLHDALFQEARRSDNHLDHVAS